MVEILTKYANILLIAYFRGKREFWAQRTKLERY